MILAIDPGASGAIAVLHDDGSLAEVFDMPSITIQVSGKSRDRVALNVLADRVREWNGKAVRLQGVVEKVGAMPGQGTTSMFSFGFAAGGVEGVLAGVGVPVMLVTPQAWKKAMHLGRDKGAARMRAMQEWPAHASQFIRVKDDGRAEAALLGLYLIRRTV